MTQDGPPSVQTLAAASLRLLASGDGARTACPVPDAPALAIEYRGPRPPAAVPDAIVPPAEVPRHRPWVGAHRLTVRAPILVLDIAWNAGEPLRIMSFSRGDWEAHLLAAARTK